MKLLLVCMEHNYGDPARGRSYEYYNFYETLRRMRLEPRENAVGEGTGEAVDVQLFDFKAEEKALGREAMNHKLIEVVKDWQPELTMFSLYEDEIAPETVRAIQSVTKTLCFFHDDTWREEFSLRWARVFDWFTTPDVRGPDRYRRLGLNNVIWFPFGCDEETYRFEPQVKKEYDVSFVGAWHPYREWLLNRVERSGLKVHRFGHGWSGGVVDQAEMIRIFNATRVNLNLSNSASWDARYLLESPRGLWNRLRSPKTGEQLKARIFELACCGAFELSYYVEGLERHFKIGEEIGIYLDPEDLVRKARFYLENAELRDQMAQAGRRRALKDHTFKARFHSTFKQMGLV